MKKAKTTRHQLPTAHDFDPWDGCLDAIAAAKHFHGLDLDAAYLKFCENPCYYQEDFMFMGPKAFRYYFPVVDRFLRETENDEAWILGKAMSSQIDQGADADLLNRISALSAYVLSHLRQYASSPRDLKRIEKAWREVNRSIDEHTNVASYEGSGGKH